MGEGERCVCVWGEGWRWGEGVGVGVFFHLSYSEHNVLKRWCSLTYYQFVGSFKVRVIAGGAGCLFCPNQLARIGSAKRLRPHWPHIWFPFIQGHCLLSSSWKQCHGYCQCVLLLSSYSNCPLSLCKKATIHQVTTMLATGDYDLENGHFEKWLTRWLPDG